MSITIFVIPLYFLYLRFQNKIVSLFPIKSIVDPNITIRKKVSEVRFTRKEINDVKEALKETVTDSSKWNRNFRTDKNDLLFKVENKFYMNDDIWSVYSDEKSVDKAISESCTESLQSDENKTEPLGYDIGLCTTGTFSQVLGIMEGSSSCSINSEDLLKIHLPDIEKGQTITSEIIVQDQLSETESHTEWLHFPSDSDDD